MKAIFNKWVVAQNENILVVEGNYCFPLEISIRIIVPKQVITAVFNVKIEAFYYVIKVNDEISVSMAEEIISHVAFLKNVIIKK